MDIQWLSRKEDNLGDMHDSDLKELIMKQIQPGERTCGDLPGAGVNGKKLL